MLTEGRPATELGPDGLAALKGEEVRRPPDLERWRIVEEGPERVALIAGRDEDGRRMPGGEYRFLAVERFGPRQADGRRGWHMRSSGRCDLRRELGGGLGSAELALESVSGSTVRLKVTEIACASGRSARGRIEVAGLEENDREVRLLIGVSRAPGRAQTCQGNPRTPFTVELSAPLGDRGLLDAAIHPVRQIR
ncbi:hypothetical protein ACFWY5_50975 [Nonomuraea sp. NPDC059007]|uniref:hypothetical protein n=1 Tax=Nonomuraea sp. NPDC059007 TaxID=3346692 RepID=UPI00367EBA10